MPSRSTLIRWGGLAAVAAGALYLLGAVLTILGHPSAYLFARQNLPGDWGLPIRLLTLGAWRGCTPGSQATPATECWGRWDSCLRSWVPFSRRC
jgi:hypothetical protein